MQIKTTVCTLTAIALFTCTSQAALYLVDHDLNTGSQLSGTVEIPLGTYEILSGSPSPFTSIDLTVRDGSATFLLNRLDTARGALSGRLIINAAEEGLTFSSISPAGRLFRIRFTGEHDDFYYDLGGQSDAFNTAGQNPVKFGSILVSTVVVPEPSTYIGGALLLLPFGVHAMRRLRK
jgi:hypothetical protein